MFQTGKDAFHIGSLLTDLIFDHAYDAIYLKELYSKETPYTILSTTLAAEALVSMHLRLKESDPRLDDIFVDLEAQEEDLTEPINITHDPYLKCPIAQRRVHLPPDITISKETDLN